ncbi:MAG TPA: ABC transporter permease DevC [Pirellulales bacterium]|nr:ABC transporter permease DevC [Pirellulales bacterium]
MHRTPLAWLNLTHNGRRLALALAGVGFAVLLMCMELSFREALYESTVAVIRRLNADLFITSTAKYTIIVRETFSLRRLVQARALDAVEGTYPLYIETKRSNLKNRENGEALPIRVLAFNPDEPVFNMPEVERHLQELRLPDRALFDRQSKPEYGRVETGDSIELAGARLQVIGLFTLGTDFANDGNLITSDLTFRELFPGRPGDDPLSAVDIGLVRLKPGRDPHAAKQELLALLPKDVTVYTRDEYIAKELEFWKTSTPIGYIFWLGALMGFIVGFVICYQILYTDVSDHLPEFATLKAMGYSNGYFVWVVLQESVMLSLMGFVPGVALSEALCWLVAWMTNLNVGVHAATASASLLMSVAMCMFAGWAAVRRVMKLDPAELF